MKVKELIEKLGDYDPELEVILYDSYEGGYNKIDGINLAKCVKSKSKYCATDYQEFISTMNKESEALTLLQLTDF